MQAGGGGRREAGGGGRRAPGGGRRQAAGGGSRRDTAPAGAWEYQSYDEHADRDAAD